MPADRQSGKHGQARQPAARADSRPVRLDWQADAPACIPDRVHDRRFTVIRLGHTECRRGEGSLRGRDAERPRSPRPSWHRPALMGTRLPDAGGAGLRKGIPRESRCAQGGARAVARGGESVGRKRGGAPVTAETRKGGDPARQVVRPLAPAAGRHTGQGRPDIMLPLGDGNSLKSPVNHIFAARDFGVFVAWEPDYSDRALTC